MARHENANGWGDPAAFMARHGGAIARALSPDLSSDLSARQMDVQVLKRGRNSLALAVAFDNSRRFVKAFDVASGDAAESYLRERDALRIFGQTGLCPRLRQYSDDGRFLIADRIDGCTIRELIEPDRLSTISQGLGLWLGRFARKAPFRQTHENWYDYLSNYPGLNNAPVIESAREFLTSFTFDRMILSRNDGALSNFMVSDTGRMFGVDFEHARFKPYGWDLLLTARALVRLYPDKADAITHELANGFCGTGGGDPDRVMSLVRMFTIATAFDTGPDAQPSPSMAALRRLNRTAEVKADMVATAPFREARLKRQDTEVLAEFETHITTLARQAIDQTLDSAEPPAIAAEDGAAVPEPELQALCAACQGHCCSTGVYRNAFIDLATMAKSHAEMPEATDRDLVRAYLGRIPTEHVAGSCIYHGPEGCNLPRAMRSDTCNRFKCAAARSMLRPVKDHAPDSVLCVAGHGKDFRKATRTVDGRIETVPLETLTTGHGGPGSPGLFSADDTGG